MGVQIHSWSDMPSPYVHAHDWIYCDVVEAHATVLNGMDRLLSNHVAKKDKLVRCFINFEVLRPSRSKRLTNLSFFAT